MIQPEPVSLEYVLELLDVRVATIIREQRTWDEILCQSPEGSDLRVSAAEQVISAHGALNALRAFRRQLEATEQYRQHQAAIENASNPENFKRRPA